MNASASNITDQNYRTNESDKTGHLNDAIHESTVKDTELDSTLIKEEKSTFGIISANFESEKSHQDTIAMDAL